MAKLILTSICAAAALGLAACGGGEENNVAVENLEDLNAVDTSMDMNMDMNMDVNATDNAVDNATDNAADNTATNNSY